jgi:CRISPR system CASCADE complex protein casA
MTQRFNLLDESWIRVTRLDGTPDEVSLLTLFREATDITGIHGEIASQDVAILRLLLAICHRAMDGPEDLDTWREYWEEPERLGRDASAYLERYRERFDLRDPDRPFFQVADIQGTVSPISKMIIDTPKDLKRPLFTTRIGDGLESLSWSEAARWLIHVHAFDPAGLRSGALGDPRRNPNGTTPPNGPGWAGQLGTTYVTSNNLLKTMLLNVVPESFLSASIVDTETDLAPWELATPTSQCSETSSNPTGPVYCLTWQSRRVLLIGDDVHVAGLFLGNGTKTSPQNLQTVETMSSWRRSSAQEKKLRLPSVFMPVGHKSDVAFWRSLPSLIPQLTVSDTIPPTIIAFYQELMRRQLVPRVGIIPVHAVGISYDPPDKKTNVVELIDDVLSLPAGLLNPENTRLLAVVRDAMEETEQVASALRNLAGNLDRARGGSPDTASAAREHAGAAFYQVIDERFPRWLASLDEADPIRARDQWRRLLRSEAWGQQEALASAVPDTAFAGRGEGKGRMDVGKALFFFRRALNVAVPAPAQQDSSAENNKNEERTPA